MRKSLRQKFEEAVGFTAYALPMAAGIAVEKTAEAARFAVDFSVAGVYAGAVATVKAANYVTSGEYRAYLRKQRVQRAETAAMFRAMDDLRDASVGAVLNHPAARDARELADIGPRRNRENNAAQAVSHGLVRLSTIVSLAAFDAEGEGKKGVVLERDGAGWIRQLTPETGGNGAIDFSGKSVAQAQKLWNWIYDLAATGEAPNLIPGLKLEAEGGKVIAMHDTDISLLLADDYKRAYGLWKADRDAAVAKRQAVSAPRQKQPKP